MKAQITKVDITPKEPCYLCGHAIRLELSQGVMDPLYVTALIIEDDEKKSVYLSYDLIMLDIELSDQIKNAVMEVVDCKKEHIVVSFIHTHAAPETGVVSVFNDRDKGARPGYREFLVNCAREAVMQIVDTLEEVDLYYATTMIDGYYSNRNSKDKPCDKSANMLRLIRKDNSILAMMVNMTCHPTVLGAQNYLISADLFGAIRTGLEKHYDCGVLMMQGAAGDMGNRQYRLGNDQKELFRMRDGILPQLIKVTDYHKVDVKKIQYASTQYIMDYDIDLNELKERLLENQSQLATQTDANQIKLLSSGIKGLQNVIEEGEHVHLVFDGKFIKIGNCILVCIPCELFNQFGVQIKKAFPQYDVIIWGYCDYSNGYLVEEEEYGKSYESIATQINKGMSEKYVAYLKEALEHFLAA